MNTPTDNSLALARNSATFAGKLFALLSVLFFWVAPVSALLSMLAIRLNRRSSVFWQRMSKAGAYLCIAWVVIATIVVAFSFITLSLNEDLIFIF